MKGDGLLKYDVIKAAVVFIAGLCIVALPFLYVPNNGAFLAVSAYAAHESPIILDAGHGGEDGGAIGVGGILEKDINLSVTLKTNAILRFRLSNAAYQKRGRNDLRRRNFVTEGKKGFRHKEPLFAAGKHRLPLLYFNSPKLFRRKCSRRSNVLRRWE